MCISVQSRQQDCRNCREGTEDPYENAKAEAVHADLRSAIAARCVAQPSENITMSLRVFAIEIATRPQSPDMCQWQMEPSV